MTDKSSFTAAEWTRVLASPVVVGAAITAADPSGLWGIAKEGLASGWALVEAQQSAAPNSLIKAVATDFATPEGRSAVQAHLKEQLKVGTSGELRDKAVAELQAVGEIIDLKSPLEASAFKGWLREIAQKAAEAAKEGGFLGFGGVAVSEAERMTIAEIGTALGHLTSRVDSPAPSTPSHALAENAHGNLDSKLDNAIDESFPASDPVSVRITK